MTKAVRAGGVHYNPETDKIGKCSAHIQECPLIRELGEEYGEIPHFETEAEARVWVQRHHSERAAAAGSFFGGASSKRPQAPSDAAMDHEAREQEWRKGIDARNTRRDPFWFTDDRQMHIRTAAIVEMSEIHQQVASSTQLDPPVKKAVLKSLGEARRALELQEASDAVKRLEAAGEVVDALAKEGDNKGLRRLGKRITRAAKKTKSRGDKGDWRLPKATPDMENLVREHALEPSAFAAVYESPEEAVGAVLMGSEHLVSDGASPSYQEALETASQGVDEVFAMHMNENGEFMTPTGGAQDWQEGWEEMPRGIIMDHERYEFIGEGAESTVYADKRAGLVFKVAHQLSLDCFAAGAERDAQRDPLEGTQRAYAAVQNDKLEKEGAQYAPTLFFDREDSTGKKTTIIVQPLMDARRFTETWMEESPAILEAGVSDLGPGNIWRDQVSGKSILIDCLYDGRAEEADAIWAEEGFDGEE